MKMVMAVVPREKAEEVLYELIDAGHSATFLDSRGGMLRQSQLTLFIALKKEELENVLAIIRDHCSADARVDGGESQDDDVQESATEVQVGGATVFVWELGRLERY